MKIIKVAINRALGMAGYRAVKKTNAFSPDDLPLPQSIEKVITPETLKSVEDVDKQSLKKRRADFSTKFSKYKKANPVVKLHFGCGPRVLKDWVNVDLSFEPFEAYLKYYTDEHYPENIRGTKKDFYEFDVTKGPLPIPDQSVDVIFHEDFFEHISQRDQVAFLAETRRVLKKGGVHRINTPDLLQSMKTHSDFSKGYLGVYFNEWDGHEHLSVITKKTLEELAIMVGYSKVIFNTKNGSTSKMLPREYRPDPNDRPLSGNVYADLIK